MNPVNRPQIKIPFSDNRNELVTVSRNTIPRTREKSIGQNITILIDNNNINNNNNNNNNLF